MNPSGATGALQAGVYADRYARVVPQVVRRYLVPLIAPLLGHTGKRWLAMNDLSLASLEHAYSNSESWYSSLKSLAGPKLRLGLVHDFVKCRTVGSDTRTEASPVQRIL